MANNKNVVANNEDNKLLKGFDIVFCIIMLPMMILVFPVERWFYDYPLFVFVFLIWLYAVYFVNRKLTIPLAFKSARGRWIATAILLASIAVTYGITLFNIENPYYYLVQPLSHRFLPWLRKHQQSVWILFVAVEAFSFFVGAIGELQKQRERQRAVETEHQKAELALYRAQINPHFLFNTLNMLYGMVITRSERTEEAFVQFIDMMKYMYTHAVEERVPVSEETGYLQKYVDLQRNRMGECTKVIFNHSITPDGSAATVAPMLLITFVENAFKYGVSSHEESTILINLHVSGSHLHFDIDNPVMKRGNEAEGIGIANCRRRLELLYPSRHSLAITDDGRHYHVDLDIQL